MQICSGSYFDESGIGRKPSDGEIRSLKAFAELTRSMLDTVESLDKYISRKPQGSCNNACKYDTAAWC